MCQEWEHIHGTFDGMLTQHGLVQCLFALAHAVRGENDKGCQGRSLIPEDERLCYLREYIANQIMGAAAFWGVHRTACGDR
jgi:hypothetical protein